MMMMKMKLMKKYVYSRKYDHLPVSFQIIGSQLAIDQVLHGLPNWLDRLFEGSINRYYVPEWPDNLK